MIITAYILMYLSVFLLGFVVAMAVATKLAHTLVSDLRDQAKTYEIGTNIGHGQGLKSAARQIELTFCVTTKGIKP